MNPATQHDVPFHSRALVVWLIAAVLPTALTRHPGYLLLTLATMLWVQHRVGRHSPTAGAWGGVARLAMVFVLFTVAANALLGGHGATVLLRLPSWQWRADDGRVLFQLGGPVTAESLTEGLISAVALLAVIYALAAFNTLADHYQLLRDLPAVFYQGATVISIALTFLPQLVTAQRQIRQAHALRGQRIRGLRDLLPLLVTLLAEGLDRAMTLAESMEARGFSGAPRPPRVRRLLRWGIALGLALALAGSVLRGIGRPGGVWLLASGLVVLGVTLWWLGKDVQRTRHRRAVWRRRDTLLTVASLMATAGLVYLHLQHRGLLHYQAWPAVQWPRWSAWVLLALVPLLAPAFLLGGVSPNPPSHEGSANEVKA